MKKTIKNRAGAVGVTQSSIQRRQPNLTRKRKKKSGGWCTKIRKFIQSKNKIKIKIEEQNKTKKKRKWNEGFVFRLCFCARNLDFCEAFGVWDPCLPRIFSLHFCAEKKQGKKKQKTLCASQN
jgi:hypothetical protein